MRRNGAPLRPQMSSRSTARAPATAILPAPVYPLTNNMSSSIPAPAAPRTQTTRCLGASPGCTSQTAATRKVSVQLNYLPHQYIVESALQTTGVEKTIVYKHAPSSVELTMGAQHSLP
eukprot:6463474-Amphidinium_carterae.2